MIGFALNTYRKFMTFLAFCDGLIKIAYKMSKSQLVGF